MKKITLSLLLILSTAFAFAQQGTTTVNGTLRFIKIKPQNFKGTIPERIVNIDLYKVQSGTLVWIDSTKQMHETDTIFSFKFKPSYKGYYVVGVRYRGSRMSSEDLQKYRFYAKGNDEVNVIISNNNCELTGKNTKENSLLYEWSQMLSPVTMLTFNSKIQFPEAYTMFTTLDKQSKEWIKTKKSGNAAFDNLLAQTLPHDIAYSAAKYVTSGRGPNALWEKTADDYKGYVLNTDFKKLLQDTFLFKLPFGVTEMDRLINTMGKLNWLKGDSAKGQDYLKKYLSYIPNPSLKGAFLKTYFKNINNYEQLEAVQKEYAQYIKTLDQKAALAKQFAMLSEFKKGTPGFNFTSYADVDGKPVSFSDFKGKVVVIDVWATWCGPCRGELPHLKKLEEEFHGNDNVAFIGLSTDAEQDTEKWKKFVADNGLVGTQILAPKTGEKFKTVYKIAGIPRFMVFDKLGRVVSADAPRPSDPALKEMILKTLETN